MFGAAVAAASCGPEAQDPVEVRDWMAGPYSSRYIDVNTSRYTEEEGVSYYTFLPNQKIEWYLPLADDPLHDWEPMSESEVRVLPNGGDDPDLQWYLLTQAEEPFACGELRITRVYSDTGPITGGSIYPGSVCVVANGPCPPDVNEEGESCGAYHLEWCDEPPPGCDARGCTCDD